jgi:uncharacterized metal-binding protein YceD (DUF177 family)
MPRQHSDSQEFSRFVEADSVGTHRMERKIAANPEERAALARRFGLVSVDRLEADLVLRRAGAGVIHVTGSLSADVVQSCVVTLAPVEARVEDKFATDFLDETEFERQMARAGGKGEADLDYEEDDPPEPIRNGHIDLGELAAQQLSLALDPYPRAPGAAVPERFAPPPEAEAEVAPVAERPVNPFSILKK